MKPTAPISSIPYRRSSTRNKPEAVLATPVNLIRRLRLARKSSLTIRLLAEAHGDSGGCLLGRA